MVSSIEFNDWRYYFKQTDEKEVKKDHYYLARIAFEICRRGEVKNGSLKYEDFILKFTHEDKVEVKDTEEIEKARAEYLEKTKTAWMGLGALPTPSLDVIKAHIRKPA